MKHPKELAIADFTYQLPEEKIASAPLAQRDASKLLVYNDGAIITSVYSKIADEIPANSFLVFNNTKVVEARLLFQKSTGGVIEIFCLEPGEGYIDITTAMFQTRKVLWKCLVGGASKWKPGQVLQKKIEGNDLILEARFIEKKSDHFIIELSWNDDTISFAEVLHAAGVIPLPPYIKRKAENSDAERYQTIYAAHDGSVAAPTAGLHFTNDVLKSLQQKNISLNYVTLHVGAGTFKPVKSERMEEHDMHAEFIDVSKEFIENLISNLDKNIIAVGTTSLRTIESLYWLGVKYLQLPTTEFVLNQWEVYDTLNDFVVPPSDALNALLKKMQERNESRIITKTKIIIAPGYELKIANGIITNFHQPQSTLLLLVAAVIGDDWKKVYDYALKNDFRFLSYGDGNLLWHHIK